MLDAGRRCVCQLPTLRLARDEFIAPVRRHVDKWYNICSLRLGAEFGCQFGAMRLRRKFGDEL